VLPNEEEQLRPHHVQTVALQFTFLPTIPISLTDTTLFT
jgi:hypothetical protein